MTGTAKVKPAKNDQEWARNTEKRQEQLENPTSTRVGPWVLSAQPDTENLLASHVDGGAVILAVKPESSDEPDDVAGTDIAYIKVERQTTQSGPRGSANLVSWDFVAYQTSEFGFNAPGTDIVIPVDGVYDIKLSLSWLNSSTVTNKAILLIGGSPKLTQEANNVDASSYPSFHLSNTFSLSAGTIVSAAAYTSGSGTMDFGVSGADGTVFSALSIARLAIG